jgi:hypothetical protein
MSCGGAFVVVLLAVARVAGQLARRVALGTRTRANQRVVESRRTYRRKPSIGLPKGGRSDCRSIVEVERRWTTGTPGAHRVTRANWHSSWRGQISQLQSAPPKVVEKVVEDGRRYGAEGPRPTIAAPCTRDRVETIRALRRGPAVDPAAAGRRFPAKHAMTPVTGHDRIADPAATACDIPQLMRRPRSYWVAFRQAGLCRIADRHSPASGLAALSAGVARRAQAVLDAGV